MNRLVHSMVTAAAVILMSSSVALAEPVEVQASVVGRAQGTPQGKGIAHQIGLDKGNVGFNEEKGFIFKTFIAIDLSSNLVDVEEAERIELVTHFAWGGEGSASGWKFVCLGAYDDDELINATLLSWGEADGGRFEKNGATVGTGDPSNGKASFGESGTLVLDVTEAAKRSGLGVDTPFLWFRVEPANLSDAGSWGGIVPAKEKNTLQIHVGE
ncbi:MAG: hypothetical protein AAF561_00285 [Planctomycetota bacterium]